MEIKFVPISLRAVMQRVNRKLAGKHQVLKVIHGTRLEQELWRYYVVNRKHNAVQQTHVNVEVLAKERGVLQAWEVVTLPSLKGLGSTGWKQ